MLLREIYLFFNFLSFARLNLIRQLCVVLRETFVQLGKGFRRGATKPEISWEHELKYKSFLLSIHSRIGVLKSLVRKKDKNMYS